MIGSPSNVCFSDRSSKVEMEVRAKFNLAKRFYITIKLPFVTGIPVTKNAASSNTADIRDENLLLQSWRVQKGKELNDFLGKSLNLENSLKSEVRLPSSKETIQLRR